MFCGCSTIVTAQMKFPRCVAFIALLSIVFPCAALVATIKRSSLMAVVAAMPIVPAGVKIPRHTALVAKNVFMSCCAVRTAATK